MEGLVIECNICGGLMPPEGGHDCAKTVEGLRARLAAAKERADRLAAENEALRRALRQLVDSPDVADNDHKDPETIAAERSALAALRLDRTARGGEG